MRSDIRKERPRIAKDQSYKGNKSSAKATDATSKEPQSLRALMTQLIEMLKRRKK